jgi:hypothetical protein
MTIDEAIQHCEEVMMENLEKTKDRNASDPIAINCGECAEEHLQLAEWLKELKAYRSRSEIPNTCGDAVSRQAVDDAIYDYSRSCDVNYQQIMEYIEKIPSVTPQQRTGRWIDAEVLDKTRAEIDQYLFQNEFGSAYRNEVSQIIDKYKAESEDKE